MLIFSHKIPTITWQAEIIKSSETCRPASLMYVGVANKRSCLKLVEEKVSDPYTGTM